MSDTEKREKLQELVKGCQDLGLQEMQEFGFARVVFRERQVDRYDTAIGRLQALLAAHDKLSALQNWFADQKVELLKANLDSDEISEALSRANRHLQTPRRTLHDFQGTAARLEQAKFMLDIAVARRRELIAEVAEAEQRLLLSLTREPSEKNLLKFLRTRLERLQAQVTHGYTPDLDTLREILDELNRIPAVTQTPITPKHDPLETATNAFLSRYDDLLSLAESRQLNEGLERALQGMQPTDRWSLWSKLRNLEDKYARGWTFPAVVTSKTASPQKVRELWDMMTDLLTVGDESDAALDLREALSQALGKSSGKQKKDLKKIRKELESLNL